ncbi:MAG: cytochrome-c peroxidase [Casimicrobium sp.]
MTKASLGERLFNDKRLSARGDISCASCHLESFAFSDGRPVSLGHKGQAGTRNAPSLVYAALNREQFWDGRRKSLESQVLDPFTNPREHGFEHFVQVLKRLNGDRGYRQAFETTFSVTSIEPHHVANALATYLRSLQRYTSPFDRYRAGDTTALPDEARQGLALFEGKAQCVQCHPINGDGSLSDHEFHATTATSAASGATDLAQLSQRVRRMSIGELDRAIASDSSVAALGRYAITGDPKHIGHFKTPSLRNVALTAPYMHDGSIATLDDAIEHEIYYRGLASNRPLSMTPSEKSSLRAFLVALSDRAFDR